MASAEVGVKAAARKRAVMNPLDSLAPESLPATLPREPRLPPPWEKLEPRDAEALRAGAGIGGAVSAGEPSPIRRARSPSPGRARSVILRG